MTGPELFAIANGTGCSGPHRCVYCGASASTPYRLADSFTTRDTLRCPGSQFVCAGCLLCLEEVGEARYPSGEIYSFTKAFRRMCSWVVSGPTIIAATKAHIEYLRDICLNPPAPPFLISLAVSGQKHVLYRSVVSHSRESITVTLEGEPVEYRPVDLSRRIALCGQLVSATGKPALVETPSPSFWFRVCERFARGESLCTEWERVRNEPLSRLAAFLSPAKEVAEREYPGDKHGGIPPAGRGVDRPQPKDGGGGNREREGRSHPTLFGDV